MRAVLLVLLLIATTLQAWAAESVLTLTPRPGVTLRVLVDRPAAPIGSVVLMAGGDGVLDLDAQGNIGSGLREQPPGAHACRLCGGGLCGVRS